MQQVEANFHLPPALLDEARQIAHKQGIGLDDFMYLAVSEKISAAKDDAFFNERAKRGNLARALELLDKAGSDEVLPGDEM